MLNNFPMTLEGFDLLKKELHRLKYEIRPKLTKAIAEARKLGDLSENAEYKAAREEQGFCEGRIKEIENKLALAKVIDIRDLPASSDTVRFGYKILLYREKTNTELVYQIVGEDESDVTKNKISVNSPLSKVLIGKKVGEVALLKTPSGNENYEIIKVFSDY